MKNEQLSIKQIARPIIYLLGLAIILLATSLAGNSYLLYTWIGGAIAQYTAPSFWIAALIGLYPAIRIDELLTSIAIATIMALLSTPGTQRFRERISENSEFSEILLEKLVFYGIAFIVLYCIASLVYCAFKND